MADKISAERRSRNMSKIRAKNTKPELVVRRLTHSLGYRYRLHRADLPGKPDLVFPSRKKVIFVHGCFWHQHDDPACKIARVPRTNLAYWMPKLDRNVTRYQEHQKKLCEMGWEVLVVWECETKDITRLGKRIKEFLS